MEPTGTGQNQSSYECHLSIAASGNRVNYCKFNNFQQNIACKISQEIWASLHHNIMVIPFLTLHLDTAVPSKD